MAATLTATAFLESTSGFDRIDRELGVIYGVKVLGLVSKNGRRYLPKAVEAALPLYEGCAVNIDHQRDDPNARVVQDRPMRDRWGVLKNVRLLGGEIYADLHYLKSHPLTEMLVEAAERFPDTFGLSHDAAGDERVINGEKQVVEIYRVNSVDVVSSPATNVGLFESVSVPLHQAFRASVKSQVREAFCPTGKHGGKQNSCSGKKGTGHGPSGGASGASGAAGKTGEKGSSGHSIDVTGAKVFYAPDAKAYDDKVRAWRAAGATLKTIGNRTHLMNSEDGSVAGYIDKPKSAKAPAVHASAKKAAIPHGLKGASHSKHAAMPAVASRSKSTGVPKSVGSDKSSVAAKVAGSGDVSKLGSAGVSGHSNPEGRGAKVAVEKTKASHKVSGSGHRIGGGYAGHDKKVFASGDAESGKVAEWLNSAGGRQARANQQSHIAAIQAQIKDAATLGNTAEVGALRQQLAHVRTLSVSHFADASHGLGGSKDKGVGALVSKADGSIGGHVSGNLSSGKFKASMKSKLHEAFCKTGKGGGKKNSCSGKKGTGQGRSKGTTGASGSKGAAGADAASGASGTKGAGKKKASPAKAASGSAADPQMAAVKAKLAALHKDGLAPKHFVDPAKSLKLNGKTFSLAKAGVWSHKYKADDGSVAMYHNGDGGHYIQHGTDEEGEANWVPAHASDKPGVHTSDGKPYGASNDYSVYHGNTYYSKVGTATGVKDGKPRDQYEDQSGNRIFRDHETGSWLDDNGKLIGGSAEPKKKKKTDFPKQSGTVEDNLGALLKRGKPGTPFEHRYMNDNLSAHGDDVHAALKKSGFKVGKTTTDGGVTQTEYSHPDSGDLAHVSFHPVTGKVDQVHVTKAGEKPNHDAWFADIAAGGSGDGEALKVKATKKASKAKPAVSRPPSVISHGGKEYKQSFKMPFDSGSGSTMNEYQSSDGSIVYGHSDGKVTDANGKVLKQGSKPAKYQDSFNPKRAVMPSAKYSELIESNKQFSQFLEAALGDDDAIGGVGVSYDDSGDAVGQMIAAFKAAMVSLIDNDGLSTKEKLTKMKAVLDARDEALASIGADLSSGMDSAMESEMPDEMSDEDIDESEQMMDGEDGDELEESGDVSADPLAVLSKAKSPAMPSDIDEAEEFGDPEAMDSDEEDEEDEEDEIDESAKRVPECGGKSCKDCGDKKIQESTAEILRRENEVLRVRMQLVESGCAVDDVRVKALLPLSVEERVMLIESWAASPAKKKEGRPSRSPSAFQESFAGDDSVGYPSSAEEFARRLG